MGGCAARRTLDPKNVDSSASIEGFERPSDSNKLLDKFILDSWFDPSLESCSRISYPIGDAEIISIEACEVQGSKINNIPHGRPFDIKITLKAKKNLGNVRLGCFIANANGKRVTGQSFPKKVGDVFSLQPGQSRTIVLGFFGGLWPGIYFIGAGIAQADSSGSFLHRIIDDTVIRVTDVHQVQPIGDTDLSRNS